MAFEPEALANASALAKVLQATVTLMFGSADKVSTTGWATKPEPNNKTFLVIICILDVLVGANLR